LFDKAFTPHNIKKGWAISGLWPLDTDRMLRQCTGWLDLNAAQASAIRNALPSLISAARIQGEVTDDLMQEAVGDSIDFEAASMGEIGSSSSGSEDESSIVHPPKRRGRKPLNSQALNRRRFV
jgi:hypothetical protein